MVRTPSFDKNGMKKGAWSPEEDNKLRAYIQRYGHWNWRELPKYAGLSRCGKSCRLRWMNYLRPNVKRGSYTKVEEDLIVKLHGKLGNKWSLIAAKLPGRADNEIKNLWHTHLKKRLKQNQAALELKEQALETSQSEAHLELVQSLERPQSELNQKTELGSKDVAGQPLPQLILESTSLSPEPCSSEFSSLSTSDYPVLSDMSWVAEDSINSRESFAEPIENFWNEPFLQDLWYNQNEFSTKNSAEGGFMSPYYTYYDDGIDLFYQLLQDFPKI